MTLYVSKNSIEIVSGGFLADNNSETVDFEFSGEWDGLDKTAWLMKSKDEYDDFPVVSDSITIPRQYLREDGVLCIGVTGAKDRIKLLETRVLPLVVINGALRLSAELPTVSEYKRILSYFALIVAGMHGDNMQIKNVTASDEDTDIVPDAGYTGLAEVKIKPTPTETLTLKITENGNTEHIPPAGKHYSGAALEVAVPAAMTQAKEVTAGTGDKEVLPDENFGGLSKVTVHPTPTETKQLTVTENGSTTVEPSEGKQLGKVEFTVSVPTGAQALKEVTAGTGDSTVLPDEGYNAIGKVIVHPTPAEKKVMNISADGTYTAQPDSGKHFSEVEVVVSTGTGPKTQEKTVMPDVTEKEVLPDEGYYLSKVKVNAVRTQEKVVSASSAMEEVVPDAGYFLSKVTVYGSYVGANLIEATFDPADTDKVYTPKNGVDGFSKVTVKAVKTQAKSVTPGSSRQTVFPSSGYYLRSVEVAAIPSDYKKIYSISDSSGVTVACPSSAAAGTYVVVVVSGVSGVTGGYLQVRRSDNNSHINYMPFDWGIAFNMPDCDITITGT